jgi:hypothetical protein
MFISKFHGDPVTDFWPQYPRSSASIRGQNKAFGFGLGSADIAPHSHYGLGLSRASFTHRPDLLSGLEFHRHAI